ncbi:hypothetical protein [Shewanella sp. Isolate11]|uniref:hypothetical protein n=1 Tax=Shewanella sp. Isolate11 TaxID=2908530 RepID=UPI001EFE706F|nr:hypothetical protein [Shewanella sp. Isolate11]MCG9698420.1 hypothetical protein [Shewanella sp. Isolate11]
MHRCFRQIKKYHKLLIILALTQLSACSHLLCQAQTDRAPDPQQQDAENRRCIAQMEKNIADDKRQQQRENQALLQASMDKHLKQKS